jgi:4-hydroxy-3-polyprenylbenzoate decarboxylase
MDSCFISLRIVYRDSTLPLILVSISKNAQKNSSHFMDSLQNNIILRGIMVLYDSAIDLHDDSLVLWKAFNNIDPRRDIHFTPSGVIIDATKKGPADGHSRPWPDDIEMSPEIVKLVDDKFSDLF